MYILKKSKDIQEGILEISWITCPYFSNRKHEIIYFFTNAVSKTMKNNMKASILLFFKNRYNCLIKYNIYNNFRFISDFTPYFVIPVPDLDNAIVIWPLCHFGLRQCTSTGTGILQLLLWILFLFNIVYTITTVCLCICCLADHMMNIWVFGYLCIVKRKGRVRRHYNRRYLFSLTLIFSNSRNGIFFPHQISWYLFLFMFHSCFLKFEVVQMSTSKQFLCKYKICEI